MTIQQDIAAHVEYTLARTRQVRADGSGPPTWHCWALALCRDPVLRWQQWPGRDGVSRPVCCFFPSTSVPAGQGVACGAAGQLDAWPCATAPSRPWQPSPPRPCPLQRVAAGRWAGRQNRTGGGGTPHDPPPWQLPHNRGTPSCDAHPAAPRRPCFILGLCQQRVLPGRVLQPARPPHRALERHPDLLQVRGGAGGCCFFVVWRRGRICCHNRRMGSGWRRPGLPP
jgi:hypothetical protein